MAFSLDRVLVMADEMQNWTPFPVSIGRTDGTAYFLVTDDNIEVRYEFPLFRTTERLSGRDPALLASALWADWARKVGLR